MVVQQHTKELLEGLAESLQVPPNRYEEAERRYKAVGNWLLRETSCVLDAAPKVYIQGSFRLGTVIRPISDGEDYDVDLVCELSLSKMSLTQADLKALLGREIQAYAEAHRMEDPEEGRRCWTQHYADEARFHMDILPALPDAAHQRQLLETRGFSTEWTDTAIAITDREHPEFRQHTVDWPHSNPKGYANWFHSKMRAIFEARRYALALEARANVEAIPYYEVRTPLQSAIQILKQYRDMMFAESPDDKPISIILTTLAAHAYQQEATVSEALYSILNQLDRHIQDRNGVAWIANPTDPAENFADRWATYPDRKTAFYKWLEQARRDFIGAAQASSRRLAIEALQPRLGQHLMESVKSGRHGFRWFAKVLSPAHRKTPPWNYLDGGDVRIQRATHSRKGFRVQTFSSGSDPLPKYCNLIFEACTNVSQPYKVYWQIVNTGREAEDANGLRGGFDEGIVTKGKLIKKESTLYTGTHSIECFIVKQGYLAARSGQFIVNIQ
ncbi:MAG: nucleotidyltransferase [Bacteroidetes bacterium SB0662_bin_6]|nr:nucleotidyltransferase [Bacteroidetes bacterium SB0668_bin_1]MYE04254.1 nucleotidyltransferase [Bacteroidetes bacterium SB0662_bin_6]